MLTLLDQYQEAQPYIEIALEVSEDLRLPEVYSQALNTKGISLMYRERHREAALLLRESLEVAVQNELWPAAFRAFNNLGVSYYFTDRNRDGLALFAQAVEHARRLGDRLEMAKALSSELGYMRWLGLWDEALETAHQVEDVAGPELLQTSWLVNRFASPIEVLCERGEVAEARRWAERIGPWLVSDQPDVAIGGAAIMGAISHAEGRYDEALQTVLEAQRKAPVGPNHPAAKAVWPLAMDSALRVGDLKTAEDLLAPMLSRRPGHTPPSLAGMRLRFRARVAAARGESTDVEQNFNAGIAIFVDAEMPFYQAATQLEMAEWLQSQGRGASSAAPLQEARAIFERLKARPWLERVARAGQAARV